ncbi:MAG: GDSL-type esterase/lipase family protein [Clostridiaceae bacterium]
MKEDMLFNQGDYQLREYQIDTIKKIMVRNHCAEKGGVVFFGDSITEMYDIETYYPEVEVKYNSGVSGFTSETLLWICDEAVIKLKPKLLVLMVGTNDLGNTNMRSPREIANNIYRIVDLISRNIKDIKIIVVSTLPCNEDKHGMKIGKGLRGNEIIKLLNNEITYVCSLLNNVKFIDAFTHMLDKENNIFEDYTDDGLHLTMKGYEKYTSIIKPVILDTLLESNKIY